MRIVLAITAAAAAFVMSAPTANAQECMNGWQELGNGVIIACDDIAGAPAATEEMIVPEEAFVEEAAEAPPPEEPIYTGSVVPQSSATTPEQQPLQQPVEETQLSALGAGEPECLNGYRELGNGVIVACAGF